MTILFAFLLLDLMAYNNMHKSKAAVPSCEQSNLIFAEVDLTISSEGVALYIYTSYIYIHTPPPSGCSETDKEAHRKKVKDKYCPFY